MANDFYTKGEDMDIPQTSNYMNWEEGENVFRILGAFSEKTAKQGIQYWVTEGEKRMPVRIPKNGTVPAGVLGINKFGDPEVPQFFWSFPVWNFAAKKVQILQITQKTILKTMKSYIDNPKWGDPRDYNFIVTKTVNKGKTEYDTTIEPKEKLSMDIIDAYHATSIDMDAWFQSKDPFAASTTEIVKAADKAIA